MTKLPPSSKTEWSRCSKTCMDTGHTKHCFVPRNAFVYSVLYSQKAAIISVTGLSQLILTRISLETLHMSFEHITHHTYNPTNINTSHSVVAVKYKDAHEHHTTHTTIRHPNGSTERTCNILVEHFF
jgi:hypothetical protein